jgi:hypothetical protein
MPFAQLSAEIPFARQSPESPDPLDVHVAWNFVKLESFSASGFIYFVLFFIFFNSRFPPSIIYYHAHPNHEGFFMLVLDVSGLFTM